MMNPLTPSNSIHYRVGGEKLRPLVTTFSGGEVHIKLPPGSNDICSRQRDCSDVIITAKIRSADDVMVLLMVTEALRHRYSGDIHLGMPYVPYARQDRRCQPEEAMSLKVFCDLINAQNYKSVCVADCHSDVAPALLNNCHNVPASDIIPPILKLMKEDWALVSPDAGASKKVFEVAKTMGGLGVIRADKMRNPKTGEITRTEVYAYSLVGINCLIVDDICDGGRTFVELAKELKNKGCPKVWLWVTHGIFSNGFNELREHVDAIHTTNSFYRGPTSEYVRVHALR